MRPARHDVKLRTLILVAAAFLAGAHAAAAGVFSRVAPDAAHVPAALAARTAANATLLRLDTQALATFRSTRGGELTIPTTLGDVRLALEPWDILGGGEVSVTDAQGRHPANVDVTLYRGAIEGDPGGWAVVALTPDGVQGVLSTRSGRMLLSPVEPPRRGFAPLHAIRPEGPSESAPRAWSCGVEGAGEQRWLDPDHPLRRAPGLSPQVNSNLLMFSVAVDCDYELLANKFAGDLTNATAYMLTVLGTSSLIYERDIHVQLTFPYLNFWATSDDPYNQTTTSATLPEFRSYWNANMSGVSRSIAHLVSGRNLGGGIAYLNALCGSAGYGVSAIDAVYTYPTNSTTWDVEVISHEIGHNFGSPHTHSCYWQSAGYVPPGALLDTCQASEGGCNTSTNRVPPDKGTIMSYCHLTGGINAIRLDFHPDCQTVMRLSAEAAGCQTFVAFQPPGALAAAPTSTGAVLSWTASPASGVLGYDVHRSLTQYDLDTSLLGSISGTSLPDTGFGTYYYRVRAVRAADQSEWSGELKARLCGLSAPTSFPVASGPVAAVHADFNEDGIEDIATANFISGSASVLIGQGSAGVGDGTFAAPVNYVTGGGASCLAVGDWNGDGILDLAVGNNFVLTVSVLLGQGTAGVGNGTFAPGVTRTGVPDPTGMAVGDFNEDGIQDLAVTGSGSSCQILLGAGTAGVGDGTFTLGQGLLGGSSPQGVAVSDFNDDGIADLVVVGSTGARVFLGNGTAGRGDGTFTEDATYPCGVGPASVVTTDWNGDGITDIGVDMSGAGTVAILLGQGSAGVGDGTFSAAASFPAGSVPYGLHCVDWNGDGVPDATVANSSTSNTASVLISDRVGGTAPGTLGPAFAFAAGNSPRGLEVGDVNEDGAPDMLVVDLVGSAVSILRGSCITPLSTTVQITTPNGAEQWAVGDEREITWTRGAGVFAVNVQVSRDGGANWLTIAENVTGTSYAWSVTEPVGSQVRVRVVDPVFANRHDESDADFEVLPAGALAAPGAGPAVLALAGAFPNPARRQLTVAFALPDDRPATLELLDLAGRRVGSAPIGSFGAGSHRVSIVPGRPLHAGLYLVRLHHPSGDRSLKVAFLE